MILLQDSGPCSTFQERFYSLRSASYSANVPVILHSAGPLNIDILCEALRILINRHEALRMRFTMTDSGVRQQPANDFELPVPLIDMEVEIDPLNAAIQAAWADLKKQIDLDGGLPINVKVFRIRHNEHVIAIIVDHIAGDVSSGGIILRDLRSIYVALQNNTPIDLPPLKSTYMDFARWQRNWLAIDGKREIEACLKELEGFQTEKGEALSKASTIYECTELRFALDAEIKLAIDEICSRQRLRPFTAMVGAYAIALSKLTHRRDLVITNVRANRRPIERRDLVGCFANFIFLRLDLDKIASDRYLKQVETACRAAYAREDVPFTEVCSAASAHYGIPSAQLVEFRINVLPDIEENQSWTDALTVRQLWYAVQEKTQSSAIKVDLILRPHNGSYQGIIRYDIHSFDEAWALRLKSSLCEVIITMARNSDYSVERPG